MNRPSDNNEPERSRLRRTVTAVVRPALLRKHPEYAVIITAVSLIVAIVALVRDFTGYTSANIPNFSSGSITVDQADVRKSSMCTYVSGSAPDRDDATLWMALRDRDLEDARFFLEKVTHVPGSERWDQKFRMGDEHKDVGHTFDIYVFFVSNDVSRFIDGLRVRTWDETGEAYSYFDSLPPQVSTKPLATMVRTDEKGDC